MDTNWKPVKLAAKVIGHISQGMYRTPSGAVKELISNAYDARATYVKIHTGFPRFEAFSCEDNGTGIAKHKFIELMSGGIGDSDKRNLIEVGLNGRPVIGRLGVGLLSLAQICPQFRIRSFHGQSKTAFEAEIKFPPYSRRELDKFLAEHKGAKERLITHGQYHIEDIAYEKERTGLTVTTTSLRDSFRKTMSTLDRYALKNFKGSSESYPDFDRFLEAMANRRLSSLFFASPYDQFLFGLALASPIPYVDPHTNRGKEVATILTSIPPVAHLQETLHSYDFRVEVDNIQLRRPLILPSNGSDTPASQCKVPLTPVKDKFKFTDGSISQEIAIDRYDIEVEDAVEQFKLYWFSYNQKVNGYPLRFNGYIFSQTTRLFPKEYQGILIRIRDVAVGEYDVNVMTYPQAEGPRFSMISSEVFIHEGLDDALKVDRDGFNTLDPQYIRLQAFIHSLLHTLIFPGSWSEEKLRNEKKRRTKDAQTSRTFESALRKATNRAVSKVEMVTREEVRRSAVPVEVDHLTKSVRIFVSNPVSKAILRKKKSRGLASRVMAAFEVANTERNAERRREIFLNLLGEIFNE